MWPIQFIVPLILFLGEKCCWCKGILEYYVIVVFDTFDRGSKQDIGANYNNTRSTPRAQTSLAEADHYSHIVHCKNVEPWLWKTTHPLNFPPPPKKKKKKKKNLKNGSGTLPAWRSGYATTVTVFFCSFTHLTIPRSPPKFNQFFLVLLRTRP